MPSWLDCRKPARRRLRHFWARCLTTEPAAPNNLDRPSICGERSGSPLSLGAHALTGQQFRHLRHRLPSLSVVVALHAIVPIFQTLEVLSLIFRTHCPLEIPAADCCAYNRLPPFGIQPVFRDHQFAVHYPKGYAGLRLAHPCLQLHEQCEPDQCSGSGCFLGPTSRRHWVESSSSRLSKPSGRLPASYHAAATDRNGLSG